jgi:hypothetical protein
MSPEQKQDIVNRLTQQYRDAKQEASLLEAEANSIGRNLLVMGEVLANRPEEFHISGDDPNPTFQQVRQLTERLRSLRSMLAKLKSQLHDAGIDVS